MTALSCRSCGRSVSRTFVDLGSMPLANSYLDADSDPGSEPTYELHVRVCESCLLVQLPAVVSAEEIFSDYAYFSSYSDSWLTHAKDFAKSAAKRFALSSSSRVIEVASNDGYLLRNFVQMGVPSLGIEPAANVAKVAETAGVPTRVAFFGADLARELHEEGPVDLVVANNVLAHVPDLNDFVAGLAIVLASDGVASIEVPHLANLVAEVQFDTIYHEHFSYFTLLALEVVFDRHGLRVFDVERIPTHGGSLRVLVCLRSSARAEEAGRTEVLELERSLGLDNIEAYDSFSVLVEACRRSLLDHLERRAADGRTVVGYGAAAKGNTLLNFCGVGPDLVRAVGDRNPHKQGRLLPGSRIPVVSPEDLPSYGPHEVLVLPWNIADEVVAQLEGLRRAGAEFVVAIPTTRRIA